MAVGNFAAAQFDRGASVSAVNLARSALSALLPLVSGQTVGSHPDACRLIKGVFEERPALPRYEDTWNVVIVLKYLDQLQEAKHLSLKDLTLQDMHAIIFSNRTDGPRSAYFDSG